MTNTIPNNYQLKADEVAQLIQPGMTTAEMLHAVEAAYNKGFESGCRYTNKGGNVK